MSGVRYWIVLGLVLVASYGSLIGWRKLQQARATDEAEAATTAHAQPPWPEKLSRFELVDQQGQAFDSDSLQGRPWVCSFFFTACPAICWRMNQSLAGWQQTTPELRAQFVSITCDPDTDTPEVLQTYADKLHADPEHWKFLTGPLEAIRPLGKDLFVSVEKGTHSDRAFVVDATGKVRGQFSVTDPDGLERLKKLLAKVEAETAASQPGN